MSAFHGDTPNEGSLYAQLVQKEQDLYLAAELGKALLEKNQDLSVRNEQLMDEYSVKIEELEQERHELHLRLEKIESEYENTVKELQFDIGHLRHELQSTKQQEQMGDRERSQTIRNLKQQNERLNEQLKQSSHHEDHLEDEVQTLREQMMSKRTSMHEHVIHLEMLREEKQRIEEKCQVLEQRIVTLMDERDGMACSLEESQDRILLLERQKQEKDQLLHQQHREVLELQEANAQLQAQVEHLSQQSQTSSTGHSMNLFTELTAMSPGFERSLHSVHSDMSMSDGMHPLSTWQRSMSAEMLDEDDFECDGDEEYEMSVLVNSTYSNESSFLSEFQAATATAGNRHEDKELRNEVIGTYQQLRKMLRLMKGESMCSTDSDEEGGAHGGQGAGCQVIGQEGPLGNCLHDLQQLMQDMMTMQMERSDYDYGEVMISPTASGGQSMDCVERSISDLHVELVTAQRDLQKVQQECAVRDAQLMQKSAEFAAMAQRMQEQQDRLLQLQRERDRLQDTQIGQGGMGGLGRGLLSKDFVVEQARKDRDIAMEKGHQLEVELAKAKMDLMSLNDQLVGAIKQKVTLSQELDQWQTDMEHLLHYQKQEKERKQSKEKDTIAEKEEDEEDDNVDVDVDDEDDDDDDELMKKSTSVASFFSLKKKA